MFDYEKNETTREVYQSTKILRRTITGIVSGYHQLPYILVAPDDENAGYSVDIRGTINVSPKFVISAQMLGETFGDVFDPSTFDKDLQGRLFSFFYSQKRNMKVESQSFVVAHHMESANSLVDKIHEDLLREENVRTGLIFCPRHAFYPVSLDRFIGEMLNREMSI